MKVLISDPLDPSAVERLRAAGHEVIERFGLKGPALTTALEGCQALVVRGATQVTAEVLRSSQSLRVVARAGTGLDNVAVGVAQELGIRVFNAPGANAISVAELTLALMLALERRLVETVCALREGRWEKGGSLGRELSGKRLGLVGFGRIGREVALRARAFRMHVWASDPLLDPWPTGFGWVSRAALDEMLPQADYVSLHVPLTAATRCMLGARELARMRSGAVLVNCARGGIVDETALLEALKSGTLRGAALDVFENEPPGKQALFDLPNVIATPHLGASTREAQARAGLEAAERVVEALATS